MNQLREGSPEWVAEQLKSNPIKSIRVAKLNADMIVGYLSDYEPELSFKVKFEGSEAVFRNDLGDEAVDGLADQLASLELILLEANRHFDDVLEQKRILEGQVAELSARLQEQAA